MDGLGSYSGDVAWGGNWFFLIHEHGEELTLANAERLTFVTQRIVRGLASGGCGDDGGEIDHVELYGPPTALAPPQQELRALSRRRLRPLPMRDWRKPSKLACLVDDGKLEEGEVWRQESIVGSVFEGSVLIRDGRITPRIRGSAYVNAEATLLLDPADPFRMGIRA